MSTSDDYNETYVSEICSRAKKDYDLLTNKEYKAVLALASPYTDRAIDKEADGKKGFALALYRVEALLHAPAASRVEDMPSDFAVDYLEAISEANIAVGNLKRIFEKVVSEQCNIHDTALAVLSVATEGIDSGDIPSNKRVKYDKCEEVQTKLKAVCDSYEKARLILVREMKKCKQIMETIMTDASSDEDEVLFNVRGELVTVSKATLVNKRSTGRTYFDCLLSSGQWKTDIIGMNTIQVCLSLV
jgi:hypothetical protein